jgi:hypothetical protein
VNRRGSVESDIATFSCSCRFTAARKRSRHVEFAHDNDGTATAGEVALHNQYLALVEARSVAGTPYNEHKKHAARRPDAANAAADAAAAAEADAADAEAEAEAADAADAANAADAAAATRAADECLVLPAGRPCGELPKRRHGASACVLSRHVGSPQNPQLC